MKKFNIILTAMILGALMACGGQGKEKEAAQGSTEVTSQETQKTAAENVYNAGNLVISNVRTVASKAGQMSVVYLNVENKGSEPDTLYAAVADTSIVAETQLHTYVLEGGKGKMVHVENIPVPAGGTLELKPGGYHIMLMGLKKDVNVGDTVEVVLKFRKAGDVVVKAVAQEKKR